jgi:hypothetical protein
MPRRREFRGVAFGLVGAFVSRNNDVGGYWALGKLYEHARTFSAREIRVDLVKSLITPPSRQFNPMVLHFQQWLAEQGAARRLPIEWLKGAEVRVQFSYEGSADGSGDVFDCIVTLTDDLGHAYQARRSGACWVHNPAKERKSART